MTSKWGGRKVKRLTALVLAIKGTTCHLCGIEGANSPDHDPPRVELLRAGVPNPDDLVYLWPSHRACNFVRNSRPITAALKAECRAKFVAAIGQPTTTTPPASPRFARRRPFFEPTELVRKASLPLPPPVTQEKTR